MQKNVTQVSNRELVHSKSPVSILITTSNGRGSSGGSRDSLSKIQNNIKNVSIRNLYGAQNTMPQAGSKDKEKENLRKVNDKLLRDKSSSRSKNSTSPVMNYGVEHI